MFNLDAQCEFIILSTEEQERNAYKTADDELLRTRYLFFDMINWKDKSY